MIVEVRGNNLEGAILKWKRMLFADGILAALKQREQHPKASTRRRAKEFRARRRLRKGEKRRERWGE
jgi:ribosomal protein S21